jgi:ribosomal protein L3
MRLIVFGRVLRSVGRKTVCSVHKYEFRTQARNDQDAAATRSDGMLQRWAEAFRKEALRAGHAGA